jgi:hypothetical protein
MRRILWLTSPNQPEGGLKTFTQGYVLTDGLIGWLIFTWSRPARRLSIPQCCPNIGLTGPDQVADWGDTFAATEVFFA